MTERDIAITVIVILTVLSILTTPFMLVSRGQIKTKKMPKSTLQKAMIWASNLTIVILLLGLAYYLWPST